MRATLRAESRSKDHSERDEDHDDDEVDVHGRNPTDFLILHDVDTDGHHDATEAAARPTRCSIVAVGRVNARWTRVAVTSLASSTTSGNESDRDDHRPVLLVGVTKGTRDREVLGHFAQKILYVHDSPFT